MLISTFNSSAMINQICEKLKFTEVLDSLLSRKTGFFFGCCEGKMRASFWGHTSNLI